MRLADQVQAWESPAPVRVAVSGAQPADAPGDGARTRGTAGRSPALDSSRNLQPPQVRARKLRAKRWERRRKSGEFLAPLAVESINSDQPRHVRPARCSWTLGQGVGIMHDGTRPAGYTGVERCGSIWTCPHCASVLRTGRAAEVEKAVSTHQDNGGQLLFFTGTVRHHKGDDLATTLGAIKTAWRKMTGNRPWKTRKQKHQITGHITATEITYGDHGWHPHSHFLFFLDAPISDEELDEFRQWLFTAWADGVEKAGAKRPTDSGLDLQRVDEKGRVLSRYLSKIQDEKNSWSAGAELARADVKHGRAGSLTPFELLDEDNHAGLDEKTRGRLWREFYQVTKGKSALYWSPGLKARFEIGQIEDEEILDEAESTELVWRTSASSYRAARRRQSGDGLLVRALECAEDENWTELAMILPPMELHDEDDDECADLPSRTDGIGDGVPPDRLTDALTREEKPRRKKRGWSARYRS